MTHAIHSPVGTLTLRPERDDDRDFLYQLFCDSRQPEFAQLLAPPVFHQVMAHQFEAQTGTYHSRYPDARFDIIELDGRPIGRIVVNRPGTMVYLVDQAIVPAWRGRGISTAIMRALMDEAAAAGFPVQLKVSSTEDPSFRLYQRLGFVAIETVPLYMQLQWLPPATKS
jgi:RimJ/RimL family protein N-acetyltransferase